MTFVCFHVARETPCRQSGTVVSLKMVVFFCSWSCVSFYSLFKNKTNIHNRKLQKLKLAKLISQIDVFKGGER